MKRDPLIRLVLVVTASLSTQWALAERGIHGILEGKILDKTTREPLIAVNILVMGTSLGAASDDQGLYQINYIRAGVYDVRFSILGYKSLVMKKVTILPDLRTRLDIELEQTAIEFETIEVRAERPLIQKDLAATSFSIGELKLDRLPVSSFREVVTLQPGTTLEGNVRGGKTNELLFLVDGLPVQDVVAGGLSTSLPKSAITGLTINTGGFDAEYGNAMSGVVNVITKTGTNRHELLARVERDSWLPSNWNQQQDRMSEVELSAGGPVLIDRLYYFTANNFIVTDIRWWQDFDHFFSSPVSREFTGFSKLEYVPFPTWRLNVQGIYSLREWRDYEYTWRYALAGLPPRARYSYRIAATFTHTLSENSFYSVSGGYYMLDSRIGEGPKEDLSFQPYQYDFFLRYVVGGDRNWWAATKQAIYSVKGDLTHHFDRRHLVKVGGEYNQYDITSDLVKYEPQMTYFGKPILDQPLLNYSNRYSYQPRSGNIYIQDKIQVEWDGSNVSFGLRWDFLDPTASRPVVEFIPISQSEYQQQITGKVRSRVKHQLSPRLSVAMPVEGSGFFFINFGHYFQFPLFDYLYSGISPSQVQGGTRSVLTGNPDLEPERVVAWEFGFKRGLDERHVASITYFQKSFRNQIDAKTLIPFDSKSAGNYGFSSYVNNAEARANGLELVISRERDDNLNGSLSYSYMVTEGTSENAAQGIQYAQWGFPVAETPFPLSWDQRHTVKLDAEGRLPWDVEGNLVVLYNSPRPYTYYPTRDGFTPTNPQKAFVPNNKRMEDVVIVNMKFSKQLSVSDGFGTTLYADVRNLLNRRNVRWIDSNGRTGGELGDPGAFYDPRRIRVGIQMKF